MMIFDDSEVIKNQTRAKIIRDHEKLLDIQITLWASGCDSNILCLSHLDYTNHQKKKNIIVIPLWTKLENK